MVIRGIRIAETRVQFPIPPPLRSSLRSGLRGASTNKIKIYATTSILDIFGPLGFSYIFGLALWMLISKKPVPKWTVVLLCAVGAVGLIVDLSIVYTFYIK